MTQAEKLAHEFSKVLHEWLTPQELLEVRIRNLEMLHDEKYKDCCATHDFCDANMAMLEAMGNLKMPDDHLMGNGTEKEQEAAQAVWSEAWSIAKKNGFRVEKKETPCLSAPSTG